MILQLRVLLQLNNMLCHSKNIWHCLQGKVEPPPRRSGLDGQMEETSAPVLLYLDFYFCLCCFSLPLSSAFCPGGCRHPSDVAAFRQWVSTRSPAYSHVTPTQESRIRGQSSQGQAHSGSRDQPHIAPACRARAASMTRIRAAYPLGLTASRLPHLFSAALGPQRRPFPTACQPPTPARPAGAAPGRPGAPRAAPSNGDSRCVGIRAPWHGADAPQA